MKKTIILLAMALVLAACGADDIGGTTLPDSTAGPDSTTTIPVGESDASAKVDGPAAKLTSHLASAAEMAAEGAEVTDIAAANPVLEFDGDAVLVEVTVAGSVDDVIGDVEAAGLHVSDQFDDLLLITGGIGLNDLLDLAALDGVVSVVPAFGATTN